MANVRSGKSGLALASTTPDEVAAVARVTNVDALEALPDVVPGSTLGRTPRRKLDRHRAFAGAPGGSRFEPIPPC